MGDAESWGDIAEVRGSLSSPVSRGSKNSEMHGGKTRSSQREAMIGIQASARHKVKKGGPQCSFDHCLT